MAMASAGSSASGGSGVASAAAPPQQQQPICPTCSCTDIDIVDVSGEAVCVSCGTILDETNIVSSIEFHESGGGAHAVVGQFVSSAATKSYGNIGTNGRNYGLESRANTLSNGKKKIRQIAGMLRLGDHYVDSAFRLFALALQRNFTHGRKSQTVIAACLYIVCRRERSPHLLIDFSDKLQINVYVLGGVFLKFCKLLQIHLPLIDPSLYIHRFASQLNFGAKTHGIATTALRLVATMKRDWIETGRRPSGICGAALLIAARSQSVMCSLHDVMDIVNIGERTLKQRLYEFSLTPTAQLTYDQVGRLEMSRVECDPPSFQRHREKEVMEMLLLESERLPLENGARKRVRRIRAVTQGEQADAVEEGEEEDEEDEGGEEKDEDGKEDQGNGTSLRNGKSKKKMPSKKRRHSLGQLKDEDMSRFLSGDAFYKKRLGASGVDGSTARLVGAEMNAGEDKLSAQDDEEDDDEIDYGFENANDQIVNRASRLAAQEVLTRVRRKSARYIMRKREEADFYKTIERDLTLALEDDGGGSDTDAVTQREPSQSDSRTLRRSKDKTSRREGDDEEGEDDGEEEEEDMSYASRQLRRGASGRNGANANGYGAIEEPDEELISEDLTGLRSSGRIDGGESKCSTNDASAQDGHAHGDTLSDLDDDEIDSLLLTKEEAEKKKILWEKMNADYIKEQEEKRLVELSHPELPRKKRKKKVPDVNVPPPDTAQHAIYKLKSRRINYEVIDELFGEAANNGF